MIRPPRERMCRCGHCGSTFPESFYHSCPVEAHAARKLAELERLMTVWARGRDVVLAKASAKVLRQLAEVGAEGSP